MSFRQNVTDFLKQQDSLHYQLFSSFLSTSGICERLGPETKADGTAATETIPNAVYDFLGYHMIKNFDLLKFLKDTGVTLGQLSESESDEEYGGQAEGLGGPEGTQQLRMVYRAAPAVVTAFLHSLEERGWAAPGQLAAAMHLAVAALEELPYCALLARFLPGPLNSCRDLAAEGRLDLSEGRLAGSAALVKQRLQALDPHFDYAGNLRRYRDEGTQVLASYHQACEVVSVEGCQVSFSTCWQASRSCPPLDEGVSITFDPATASLFRVGMVVTGCFSRMSDGSWAFSQPGYVWPSWYYRRPEPSQAEASAGLDRLSLNGGHA